MEGFCPWRQASLGQARAGRHQLLFVIAPADAPAGRLADPLLNDLAVFGGTSTRWQKPLPPSEVVGD